MAESQVQFIYNHDGEVDGQFVDAAGNTCFVRVTTYPTGEPVCLLWREDCAPIGISPSLMTELLRIFGPFAEEVRPTNG